MENKHKIAYIDEEEGWQSSAYHALSDEFEMEIPKKLPRSIENIWEIIKNDDVQAVIIDYRLNESGTVSYTGDDVIREIRKHNKHLPAFIITSYEENAIDECKETMAIRDKEMLTDSDSVIILKKMINSSINRYNHKKDEMERVIMDLQNKIERGESLSVVEEADRFDAELYLSELDLDSSVRSNLISGKASHDLDEMISLAKEIVGKYKKN